MMRLGVRPPSRRFDWLLIVLSLWFVGGLFLDGWAHTHGRTDESFFTPWHGVLYSGHMAVLVTLSAYALRFRALPAGYGLSLIGAGLFLLSGLGDLIWHETFGIEQSIEALYSPTHLGLAISGLMIVTGGLRAGWARPERAPGVFAQLPALLSLALGLAWVMFFTQPTSPLANSWGLGRFRASYTDQAIGIVSILLDTLLLMGALLIYMRRWQPAPGAWMLVFGLSACAMGFIFSKGPYPLAHVLVRVVAGLIADVLVRVLRPTVDRPFALRVFTFAVPAVLYALYFLVAWRTVGISWSVHMWSGMIVLAGLTGMLIGFVAVPPQIEHAAHDVG